MVIENHRSIFVSIFCCSIFLLSLLISGYGGSRAKAVVAPTIDREKTILKSGKKELAIVGENFEPGVSVQMNTGNGLLAKGEVSLQSSNLIIVRGVERKDFPDGIAKIAVRNPDGAEAKETLAVIPSAIGPSPLTVSDIEQIISQGVSASLKLGFAGTFAILDREGNILGVYIMKHAQKNVIIIDVGKPKEGEGLEKLTVPAVAATISKAGVGAFFGTQGNAFTTRTAAYIIRENFPPFIKNMPSGPLFGVQLSSLACGDIKQPGLPLGLAGDTGGIPIYKNGIIAGGLGVELNGEYNVALNRGEHLGRPINGSPNSDEKVDPALYIREGIEEIVSVAAVKGFEAPEEIKADKILVNGIRLPYTRKLVVPSFETLPFDKLPGSVSKDFPIRTGVPTEFRDIKLRDRPVRVVNRFFPFKNGKAGLSASDVEQMLFQAVAEANRVRAAIRRPIEVAAEVNITVVDVEGNVLGLVSTPDAPVFGFDVSVEKARSSVLFSRPDSAVLLRNAELSPLIQKLSAEGIMLDGQVIFTSRAVGYIHRPFYPDGISDNQTQGPGPLSTPIEEFSPLNSGMQTTYMRGGKKGGNLSVVERCVDNVMNKKKPMPPFCDASNGRTFSVLNNTIMIFAGSSPIFKNGQFAGAVGVSGDGIDQDDIISAYGSLNFEVPPERRSDRFFMRGIRLPYNKFPRHPHLGEE